jgi:hypothetical protein
LLESESTDEKKTVVLAEIKPSHCQEEVEVILPEIFSKGR